MVTGPTTVEEIADQVRASTQLFVIGRGTKNGWSVYELAERGAPNRGRPRCDGVNLTWLRGIVDYSPADQVVTVFAGTRLHDVQRELRAHGQCLPLGHGGPYPPDLGTVGGSISMNLAHSLEGRFGSWRDWVLGMRVVLADGRVAKCGSKAVKNVAGYDVQKLFIGARGTLGVIVEATLRTTPVALVPEVESGSGLSTFFLAAHRVRPADLQAAIATVDGEYSVDEQGSTLWYKLPRDRDPVRFEGDHVFRTLCGPNNLQIEDPTMIRLMKRAKEIFDPTGKLNPGEMGIF